MSDDDIVKWAQEQSNKPDFLVSIANQLAAKEQRIKELELELSNAGKSKDQYDRRIAMLDAFLMREPSLAKALEEAGDVLTMCREVEGTCSASYDPLEYTQALDKALATIKAVLKK